MSVEPFAPTPSTLFSWTLFIALVGCSIAIAAGFAGVPILILGLLLAVLFAFRYPFVAFYIGIFFMPFLGITLSVPTGTLAFGARVFGGSIDVSLGEVVLFCVSLAWMFKIGFLWWQRGDRNWQPRWPLMGWYFPLVVAHLASAFSPLLPDVYVVMKFAMRPVFFNYVAFIALPANLIKSRRRLKAALGVFVSVGLAAAFNGLAAMFFTPGGGIISRAHPLPIFGVAALGENHNELAELMVATLPATLALSLLVKAPRARRMLLVAALFQFAIGLFTFTRTVWIVFIVQALFCGWMVWRERLQQHLAGIAIGILLLLPLSVGMVFYAKSNTAQSSNSTRIMLSQIAMQVFETSPVFGGGAGSFEQRVGSTYLFLIEYGDPLDSHGFLQKLAAETGILGLLALALLVVGSIRYLKRGFAWIPPSPSRDAAFFLVAGAGGAFLYQLFNTSYWTGVMWLPLGLAVSALPILATPDHETKIL